MPSSILAIDNGALNKDDISAFTGVLISSEIDVTTRSRFRTWLLRKGSDRIIAAHWNRGTALLLLPFDATSMQVNTRQRKGSYILSGRTTR